MCKTATFCGSRSMREVCGDISRITGREYSRKTHMNEQLAEGRGVGLPGKRGKRNRDRNGEEMND